MGDRGPSLPLHVRKMPSVKREAASADTRSASLQNCEEGLSEVYKPSGPPPSAALPDGSQADSLHQAPAGSTRERRGRKQLPDQPPGHWPQKAWGSPVFMPTGPCSGQSGARSWCTQPSPPGGENVTILTGGTHVGSLPRGSSGLLSILPVTGGKRPRSET